MNLIGNEIRIICLSVEIEKGGLGLERKGMKCFSCWRALFFLVMRGVINIYYFGEVRK